MSAASDGFLYIGHSLLLFSTVLLSPSQGQVRGAKSYLWVVKPSLFNSGARLYLVTGINSSTQSGTPRRGRSRGGGGDMASVSTITAGGDDRRKKTTKAMSVIVNRHKPTDTRGVP